MTADLTVVLCEPFDGRSAEPVIAQELADLLAGRPEVDLLILPSIYDVAPDGPAVESLQAVVGDLVVLSWLNPRAAFWVLDAVGIKGRMGPPTMDGAARTIWCLDLRNSDAAHVLQQIEHIRGASLQLAGGAGRQPAAVSTDLPPAVLRIEEHPRARWYPVIDRDACINCLECLNFCLFGVYGLDDAGRIFVEQPDACRDGCPACARICPTSAILFPAHADPAIAGDAVVSALNAADVRDLAETERQRAVASSPQTAEHDHDPLDCLVDELERTEL